ncbi:MAG: CRTAC1 family protein [Verrucomicrobiota bacterium]
MKTSNLPIRGRPAAGTWLRHPILLGLIAGSLFLPPGPLPADQFTRINAIRKAVSPDATWGCNWVDIDADNDVDLILMNDRDGYLGRKIIVLRNDGQCNFTQLTGEEAGPIAGRAAHWDFASFGDFNNDGYPDGLVAGAEIDSLANILDACQGGAGGRFAPFAGLLPFSDRIGHLALGDYDQDGWLDVFVGTSYMEFLLQSGLRPTASVRTNMLLRNLGGTRLEPVSAPPLAGEITDETQAAVWADPDGDGDPDLLVTLPAYTRSVRLYENLGQGNFRRAEVTGLEVPEGQPLVPAWMDFNNDGRLDLAVSVDGGQNMLFRNDGGHRFTPVPLDGTALQNRQPAWADYDNDGWMDLVVSGGEDTPQTCQLWHNNGDGSFTRITTEGLVNETGLFHAAAWADIDNDGFMDVILAGTGLNLLYRNNGNGNHWLKVELVGTGSNRSAIGAKVRTRASIGGREFTQLREITAGSRCQDDPRAHFGLGDALSVEMLRIEWPSGIVQEFSEVMVDQYIVITEPRRPHLQIVSLGSTRVEGWLEGDPDWVCTIESSTDLETWQATTYVMTQSDGRATWSDAVSGEDEARFYRVQRLGSGFWP